MSVPATSESDDALPSFADLCDTVAELPPVIDPVAFSALEKTVSVPALIEMLQSYIVTAEQLTNALAQACGEDKWDEAADQALALVGAAGGLGLVAIVQAARGLAHQIQDGDNRHALRNAAQMVVGEHIRARLSLTKLYPSAA